MSKKVIAATAILAFVCIGGIVTFLLMKQSTVDEPVAEIFVDNKRVRTMALSQDLTFTVDTEYGYNEVEVKCGYISVIGADCPDKVCVNTGATNSSVVPIICLPHHLEIRIVSAEDADIDAEIH